MPHRGAFVVQARLADGSFVTFDSRVPPEAPARPWRLLASLAVLLPAVLVLTLVAVRWVTRPLATLAEAAEQLGEDLDRPPLEERGPLEVSRAARAFNRMQRRLAQLVRDRSRIFAAMSHDLKTPITRLRLRAELLEDPAQREKFTRDLQEMEEMVRATLDFMQGLESPEPLRPLDVMALLASLQDEASGFAPRVRIEGAAQAPYPGRVQALRRCLGNLIDNAVKYGGSAVVSVEDSLEALRIRIRDRGPGIPEGELERVFEPFYRLEGSRSRETGGSGLGLAIARNVVRAHGGEVVLRNHPEGGLEAIVSLPRGGARRPQPAAA